MHFKTCRWHFKPCSSVVTEAADRRKASAVMLILTGFNSSWPPQPCATLCTETCIQTLLLKILSSEGNTLAQKLRETMLSRQHLRTETQAATKYPVWRHHSMGHSWLKLLTKITYFCNTFIIKKSNNNQNFCIWIKLVLNCRVLDCCNFRFVSFWGNAVLFSFSQAWVRSIQRLLLDGSGCLSHSFGYLARIWRRWKRFW